MSKVVSFFGDAFLRHKLLCHGFWIEVIHKQVAARLQKSGKMPHNALHGLGLVEVAQACEEVGHKVKGAMPTALTVQLPQVVDLKLKPLVGRDKRMVPRRSDARFTQVEGVNVPSSLEKCPGMAPRAASSVQHASRACEAFLVEQGLDKLSASSSLLWP